MLAILIGCGGPSPDAATDQTDQSAGGEATTIAVALLPSGDLAAAIAGAHRSSDNRARDQYRHPRETLELFGIAPDMRGGD